MDDSVYKCNLCTEKPLMVPVDEIGVALMRQHLVEEHNVARDWEQL